MGILCRMMKCGGYVMKRKMYVPGNGIYNGMEDFREILWDRKRRAIIVLLTALVSAVVISGGRDPLRNGWRRDLPWEAAPGLTAWWGVMYPEFCFAQGVEAEEDAPEKRISAQNVAGEKESGKRQVKFTFWIAGWLKRFLQEEALAG